MGLRPRYGDQYLPRTKNIGEIRMNKRQTPQHNNRKPLRLAGYDYTKPGAYFVTVCTQNRACILGEAFGDKIILSNAGDLVEKNWQDLTNRYPTVELDIFVVMPNHIHGVLFLSGKTKLGQIMRAFKSLSAIAIRSEGWAQQAAKGRAQQAAPLRGVWQRGYYDHVVRNEAALSEIRKYVQNNPANWSQDAENPHRSKPL